MEQFKNVGFEDVNTQIKGEYYLKKMEVYTNGESYKSIL